MSSRYYTKRQNKKRPKKGEPNPPKPRSFKTAEAVKEWAKANDITKFQVDQIAEKKFKIRTVF